jgi:hypothetical protein
MGASSLWNGPRQQSKYGFCLVTQPHQSLQMLYRSHRSQAYGVTLLQVSKDPATSKVILEIREWYNKILGALGVLG